MLFKAWKTSGLTLKEIEAKSGIPYKRVWNLLKLTNAKSTDRECQAPTLQGVLFALGHPLRFEEFEHIPAPISGADEVKLIYAYRRLRDARMERAYGAVLDMVRWADEAEKAVASDKKLPEAVAWDALMSEAGTLLQLVPGGGERQSPREKQPRRRGRATRAK